MNSRQRAALVSFAKAVKDLRDEKVIRSDRYLGDIAEFLCADSFGITLERNLREGGHDGKRGDRKVQVKYGGGSKTNVDLGDPFAYDEIYVVLGKGSVVRAKDLMGDFVVYVLTSEEVLRCKTKAGKYSCGASRFAREPDRVIHIEELAADPALTLDVPG